MSQKHKHKGLWASISVYQWTLYESSPRGSAARRHCSTAVNPQRKRAQPLNLQQTPGGRASLLQHDTHTHTHTHRKTEKEARVLVAMETTAGNDKHREMAHSHQPIINSHVTMLPETHCTPVPERCQACVCRTIDRRGGGLIFCSAQPCFLNHQLSLRDCIIGVVVCLLFGSLGSPPATSAYLPSGYMLTVVMWKWKNSLFPKRMISCPFPIVTQSLHESDLKTFKGQWVCMHHFNKITIKVH